MFKNIFRKKSNISYHSWVMTSSTWWIETYQSVLSDDKDMWKKQRLQEFLNKLFDLSDFNKTNGLPTHIHNHRGEDAYFDVFKVSLEKVQYKKESAICKMKFICENCGEKRETSQFIYLPHRRTEITELGFNWKLIDEDDCSEKPISIETANELLVTPGVRSPSYFLYGKKWVNGYLWSINHEGINDNYPIILDRRTSEKIKEPCDSSKKELKNIDYKLICDSGEGCLISEEIKKEILNVISMRKSLNMRRIMENV